MIKVCFYGAESTGKSTMAQKIATHFHTEYVPEVAREIISSNNFTMDDIVEIATAQVERIAEKSITAHKILLCDTDTITTQIYSQHYLNQIPDILYDLERRVNYDEYFFFDIDVPWVADGLRNLGAKRAEMNQKFKKALEDRGITYVLVHGDWDQRFQMVKKEIDRILDS